MRTPVEILRWAEPLAKANPRAFPTVKAAQISLSSNYRLMFGDKEITAIETGGYLMTRTGSDPEDIALYISPSIAFSKE